MKSSFLGILRSTLTTILVLGGLGVGGWYGYIWLTAGPSGPIYRTEKVVVGNLTATIGATGTIEPEEVIDVGAQVAGRITKFGVAPRDPKQRTIDYRTAVEANDVLLELDPALYAAQVAKSAAVLEKARADVVQGRATAAQTEREYRRIQALGPTKAVSASDADVARAAAETAAAAVGSLEAAVNSAQADLDMAKVNLGYCTIRSPVKGVIIDRRVNVGQTVVASLNAPSLFLIAKDLKRLQVWAQVNEADIGSIELGQKVQFTVDTYPRDVFTGKVIQIRYNASMTQNVVTYPVIVETENPSDPEHPDDHPDGKLLPYLTANLRFQVNERKNVTLVPNTALRFRPDLSNILPSERAVYEQSLRGKSPEGGATTSQDKSSHPGRTWIFVQEGQYLRPIRIRTGLTDNVRTEVVEVLNGAELKPDAMVVTGETQTKKTSNPFGTPKAGSKKES
jgi:HlyD family secretion protein